MDNIGSDSGLITMSHIRILLGLGRGCAASARRGAELCGLPVALAGDRHLHLG